MRKLLILLLFTSGGCTAAYAGTIRGHVEDAKTGEALPGIVVEIGALNKMTMTGLDGYYEFKNIPAGAYTVTVHANSFTAFSGPAAVNTTDETATLNISLTPQHKTLQEVAVVGVRNTGTSDAGARQLEKISDNILNILSTRQILLMPDVTVANVLRRMSGVTVDRGSSGEGRYPVIRGMDKRYNYTLINGIKIPSPDDKNRYVPMDLFPSEMLQRLEVIKSLTPDMEGDAIGGVMNLVLKDAPDRLMVSAYGATGYAQSVLSQSFMNYDHGGVNAKSPAEIYGPAYIPTYSNFSWRNLVFTSGHPLPDGQLGLTIGNRWFDRRLGLIVSGSFQSTDRISKDLFFALSPQPDPVPGGTQPEITDEEPRTYYIHEDRIGAHAKLDYRFDDHNRISLYGVMMQLNTYQTRYFPDSSETQRSTPGLGVVDYDYRSMTNLQSIYSVTLQGNHSVGDHWTADWSAVYSYAEQKTPDRAELQTQQTFVSNSSGEGSTATGVPILAGLSRIWQHNSDQDVAGYLNIHYRFTLGTQKFDLGAGGMARHKDRSNYYNEYDFTYQANTPFTTIQNAPFILTNSGTPESPNSYDATENISAGYGEVRWIPGVRWNILAGIRFESTNQSYNQYELPAGTFAKTGTVTYVDPLPSLQVKYQLGDRSALHLAYFSSISRPGFFEIVPYVFPGEYYTEEGNYMLRHVQAKNVDLRYELFPGGADQLLLGVFYKNIQNPIEYVYERPATSESVIEPENVGTATNFGAEFVYTHYFHRFGISANYTYTHSNIPTSYKYYYTSPSGNDTVTYFTKNRPLQGQAAHIGNLSLLYKDPVIGLELQLATIYTGRHITYLSQYGAPNGDLDYWQRGEVIEDFSGEKTLGKHFSIYTKLNNLFNTADIIEMLYPPSAYQKAVWPDASKRSDRILVEKKQFGQTYLIGLRYHL
jgi:TonB dependent receptor/TonB-dependent Receptor Plug Domain/CarboxypepD_reg-like domain